MLRIYSMGFLENETIEELTPWPYLSLVEVSLIDGVCNPYS
jgi:hypothetical protein